MTKIDENIQTAQNMLSGMVEKCYKLEEENKKLKKENKNLEEENLLQLAEIRRLREHLGEHKRLKKENRKLKETIKDHQLYEEKLEHRIIELEELLHGE